jgi:pyridoxamine 5'-phosphate oxidase
MEHALSPDPFQQFEAWLRDAVESAHHEPTAMTLATCTADGRPSARMVLLKDVTPAGFVFYTNYESQKARELEENPRAALVFWWGRLERQVRVEGDVERVSREESEAYFRTRPRGSRIGAWASAQSRPIDGRAALEARVAEVEQRFPGEEVPLPPWWGGYRLRPTRFEFWQGRPSRLHERWVYTPGADGWRIHQIMP